MECDFSLHVAAKEEVESSLYIWLEWFPAICTPILAFGFLQSGLMAFLLDRETDENPS